MKIRRNASIIRRDDENKRFRIAMASATPCDDEVFDRQRGQWCTAPVTLEVSGDAIDLSYIQHGVPLLLGHHYGFREESLVARALDPYVSEDGKLCSDEIAWGSSDTARTVRADVEAGVLCDVSIECDYNPEDAEGERDGDGRIVAVRVKRWRPLAAAFVVNGADPESGVNRSISAARRSAGPAVERDNKSHRAGQPAGKEAMDKDTIKEVLDLARRYGIPDSTVNEWIDKDKPIADIRREVLDRTAVNPRTAIPASPSHADGDGGEGITIDEARNYSFLRAIRALADKRPERAKNEWAVSQKLARAMGRDPEGIFLPIGLRRAFTTATASGAGLVPTDHLASEFIDALRARSVLASLGVRYLDGLRGDVSIPKKTAKTTAYWVAEHAAPTESSPAVGQVALAPHTVGAYVDISRKLLLQSSPAADAIVEDDILDTLALAIQNAVLNGTGTAGQPTGIFGTTGVNVATVETSGSPTWAEICAFNGKLDSYGLDGGKWVVAPATFSALRALVRTSYGEKFVAEIIGSEKYLADEPAHTTSQLAAGKAIYGLWSDVIVGLWGALDVKVDDCSLSTSGGLRIVGLQDVDVAVRHPEAFFVTDKFPTA